MKQELFQKLPVTVYFSQLSAFTHNTRKHREM